ncbi:hypothetical protein P8C59_004209 [Phyllachora maydis]|uniref:Nuclear pore complex protein n=1 Tax=Phyllachora maydis TaxID=1825666 RepID=A0AAD9I3L9_9PEZI|nr:hypothetical protein P8C59_004209 [Phyllachora maydis]
MSPSFEVPMHFDDDHVSVEELLSPGEDAVAALEADYEQITLRASPDVDHFAAELDRYNADLKGSPAEKRAQVFRLLESYHKFARRKADKIQERHARLQARRDGSQDMDVDVDEADGGPDAANAEELQQAEDEARTWDLLRRILPLRYRDAKAFQPKPRSDPSARSRKSYWDEFLLVEPQARERKVVLEWLQTSASYGTPIDDMVSELQQNADRGEILAHGWLHTRLKIKLQKRMNAYEGVVDPDDIALAESHLGSNTLITQLDPDAVTRQGRKLEPEDDFFESAIWLGCFEMLRRGCDMGEIREWCSVRTELWRAATIKPLPLSNPEDEDQENFSPGSLVLWRRMCSAAARDGGSGIYDRAVYGLLAGDLGSVEEVCKSWDDFLFAHYNALLRSQFDAFLIRHGGAEAAKTAETFPVFNATQHDGGDTDKVGKRLVHNLAMDARTAEEARSVTKALQGAIIANDLDRHIFHQGALLSKHANRNEKSKLIREYEQLLPDSLVEAQFFDLSDHNNHRILAHIYIIISALERIGGAGRSSLGALQSRPQMQEVLVIAYVSYLRLADLYDMIPLYCSKIDGPKRYPTLSRNLIRDIVDTERRLRQLAIMKKLGLDQVEFARLQPALYLEDVHDLEAACEAKGHFDILVGKTPTLKYGREIRVDFFGEDPELVDDEDQNIIRAIEWIMLVPGLYTETCAYAMRAYKYFLKRMHLRAARVLALRVPTRRIVLLKSPVQVVEPEEEPGPAWVEDFLAAELPDDFLAECHATEAEVKTRTRNLWELESFVRALDAIETLSSLASISREENSRSKELWQRASKEVRMTKECMKPVLNAWLKETLTKDPDLEALRQTYLPETVLAYISCLHFMGTSLVRDNLLECMELAAQIAEPDSDVAREFVRAGRMKELVESFASCSKALAIWNSEKKGSPAASKKLRESGWSRELWSVHP